MFPIIFAGTAAIGVPLLKSLAQDDRFELKLVITGIDKPAGRKLEIKPSPIKEAALELGLPVFQPENINSAEALEKIQKTGAVTLLVMAYGQIFKSELLNLFPRGCLNVHTSLLPKYRGASPIQSALLNQEKMTGISLMQMESKMDTGAVFFNSQISIQAQDNALILTEKLAKETEEEIPNALEEVLNDQRKGRVQNEEQATYCQKIRKEDGLLNWNEECYELEAKVRAFYGWPGTYTYYGEKRLKILKAAAKLIQSTHKPGRVYKKEDRVLVQSSFGSLELLELQLEGKKVQTIEKFLDRDPDFPWAELT